MHSCIAYSSSVLRTHFRAWMGVQALMLLFFFFFAVEWCLLFVFSLLIYLSCTMSSGRVDTCFCFELAFSKTGVRRSCVILKGMEETVQHNHLNTFFNSAYIYGLYQTLNKVHRYGLKDENVSIWCSQKRRRIPKPRCLLASNKG